MEISLLADFALHCNKKVYARKNDREGFYVRYRFVTYHYAASCGGDRHTQFLASRAFNFNVYHFAFPR
jgi:hypothetical protein